MKKSTMATSSILSAALVAAFSFSQTANAEPAGELFSAHILDRGYMAMVGEGKCGEGKCGEGKCGEGKCGGAGDKEDADKDDEAEDKDGEGKCGEGKCGEGKCGTA